MTLLIKNARILARGGWEGSADVFVSSGRISAMGNLAAKQADRVLDGQGAYLFPGLVDIHSEIDHHFALFEPAAQAEVLKQGVTTAIGGQDGFSIAPWSRNQTEFVRAWGGAHGNVGWRSMGEFLELVRGRALPFNFGTFAGYGTLSALAGASGKNLSKEDFLRIEKLLDRSLAEGAVGLSLDADFARAPDPYPKQMERLASMLRDRNKVLSVKLHHRALGESFLAFAKLSRTTGAKIILSRTLPAAGDPEDWQYLERKLEASGGENLYLELPPFARTVRPISEYLPEWARRPDLAGMKAVVSDKRLARKAAEDILPVDPSELRIIKAGQRKEFLGLTLLEIMAVYEIPDPREALLKLMRATGLRTLVEECDLRPEMLEQAMEHEKVLVGGASLNLLERRVPVYAYEAEPPFPAVLSWAESRGESALARLGHKLAFLPAKIFGLRGRGEIKIGNMADLALFKDGKIKAVAVSGKVLWPEDDRRFDRAAGRPWRKLLRI